MSKYTLSLSSKSKGNQIFAAILKGEVEGLKLSKSDDFQEINEIVKDQVFEFEFDGRVKEISKKNFDILFNDYKQLGDLELVFKLADEYTCYLISVKGFQPDDFNEQDLIDVLDQASCWVWGANFLNDNPVLKFFDDFIVEKSNEPIVQLAKFFLENERLPDVMEYLNQESTRKRFMNKTLTTDWHNLASVLDVNFKITTNSNNRLLYEFPLIEEAI